MTNGVPNLVHCCFGDVAYEWNNNNNMKSYFSVPPLPVLSCVDLICALGLPSGPGVCHPASSESMVTSLFPWKGTVSPVVVLPGIVEAMVGGAH